MKILIRVLALLSIAEGVVLLFFLTDGARDDADIGAGLAAFALLFAAALLGALLDGRRDPLPVVALRWGVVAALVGLVETLLIPVKDGSWSNGEYSTGNLASDLAFVAPLMAGIVVAGAVVGGALGGTLRASAPPAAP